MSAWCFWAYVNLISAWPEAAHEAACNEQLAWAEEQHKGRCKELEEQGMS